MNYFMVPGLKRQFMEYKRLIRKDIIIREICDFYELDIDHVMGRRRYKKFTIPRQMAYLFLHKYTSMNKSEIAEEFNKDHTTIIHGLRIIRNLIKNDRYLMDDYIQLESLIKNV